MSHFATIQTRIRLRRAVLVDPSLWMVGLVAVDVGRLDNWLMPRNPDYRENESMRQRRREAGADDIRQSLLMSSGFLCRSALSFISLRP
jgi:hypothetical protein